MELERTTKQLKEAIAIAGEETAKCQAAKDVIKSLTAQVRYFQGINSVLVIYFNIDFNLFCAPVLHQLLIFYLLFAPRSSELVNPHFSDSHSLAVSKKYFDLLKVVTSSSLIGLIIVASTTKF